MYKKVAFSFTPISYDMDLWLSTYQIILFGLRLPVYWKYNKKFVWDIFPPTNSCSKLLWYLVNILRRQPPVDFFLVLTMRELSSIWDIDGSRKIILR